MLMRVWAAVIRYKFANMSRETEALQSWIEVSPSTSTIPDISRDDTDPVLLSSRV